VPDLNNAIASAIWLFLVFSLVYNARSKGLLRILPTLLFIALGIFAVEFLGFSIDPHHWILPTIATVVGILIGLLSPSALALNTFAPIRWLERNFRNLSEDKRIIIMVGAFLVSIIITAIFAKIAHNENPVAFWYGFYQSWTASLVFFSILGVAGTLVSLYRPEKDEFGNRVRILFGGRQDESVEFITDAIRRIGYYSETVERLYEIQEYNKANDAYKIKVTHKSVTRNYYDDLAAKDKATWKLTPDPFPNPIDPVGHLLSFKVNGNHRISSPLPIPPTGLEYEEDIDIPKGGTATLESLVECWFSAVEQHEFAPARFAKRLSVSFVYYGAEPPALVMSTPSGGGGPIQLRNAQPLALDPMVNCHPNDTVLSFKLNPPLPTGGGAAPTGGGGTP
jgi:hypothetical protein